LGASIERVKQVRVSIISRSLLNPLSCKSRQKGLENKVVG
jgi:hypothetical protein